jgi:N utilization substance protein A
MAVLSNGRRCPNAAIPGSTYCGLPSHQALSRFETSQTAILANVAEAEVAILADPDADEGQVSEIVERASSEFVEPTEEVEETADEVATEEAIEEDIQEEAREAEEVSGETLDDDPEAAGAANGASEDAPAEEAPAEQAEEAVEEAEQA